MNVRKFLVAWLVVGVVVNVLDLLIHGLVLGGSYTGLAFMRQDVPAAWFVVLDFVFAFVFVGVYDRLSAAERTSGRRGLAFGFWVGLLQSFPAMLSVHLMVTGFPYWLAWAWTASTLITLTIAGGVAGALYAKRAVTPAPAAV